MKNKGFTLFEIMLVVALVAIIGASSAPYIMKGLYNINKNVSNDTEFAKLYDASVVIANSIYFNGIKSINVNNEELKTDQIVHEGSSLQVNGSEIISNLLSYWVKDLKYGNVHAGYRIELTIRTTEGEKILIRFYAKGS